MAIYLFCSFPGSGIAQPDIPFSPHLKSNSESWKVKVKQNGIWGNKPAQVNFGPVKTIGTDGGKETEVSREVDHELYWKNIHSKSSRETRMGILLNMTDTAEIRMLTIEVGTTKKRSLVGSFSKTDPGENESSRDSSWIDEMTIRFQKDSIFWRFIKNDSGRAYASLVKQGTEDTVYLYRVSNMDGKKMKDMMFTQPAMGFVFEYHEKQLAAFQTIIRQTTWISKTIEPELRNAILATIAALFATIKSIDANSF
jgi:hypothetical protein